MEIKELVNAFMDHATLLNIPVGIFNLHLSEDELTVVLAEESDLGYWVERKYGGYECWGEDLTSYLSICLYLNKVRNYLVEFETEMEK